MQRSREELLAAWGRDVALKRHVESRARDAFIAGQKWQKEYTQRATEKFLLHGKALMYSDAAGAR